MFADQFPKQRFVVENGGLRIGLVGDGVSRLILAGHL